MSGSREVFSHCGLRLRSEVELFLPRASGDGADVDVRWGSDLDDSVTRPDGDVVAEFAEGGRRLYTATQNDDGYVVRFPGCGEFRVSAGLDAVTVRRDRNGAHVGLLPVLMSGTVAAIVHGLRGATLLHASAVEVDGRVLAFVGRSGQGKSTIAAVLCAAGAALVTDDVLLVEPGPPTTCVGGAIELRLRPAAAALAGARPEFAARTTPDQRIAVSTGGVVVNRLPLGAVVIPAPSREAAEVSLVELPPASRLMALLAFPRIAGWSYPAVLERQFTALAATADDVPVFTAIIPWGPPFDPSVAATLLDVVRPGAGSVTPA